MPEHLPGTTIRYFGDYELLAALSCLLLLATCTGVWMTMYSLYVEYWRFRYDLRPEVGAVALVFDDVRVVFEGLETSATDWNTQGTVWIKGGQETTFVWKDGALVDANNPTSPYAGSTTGDFPNLTQLKLGSYEVLFWDNASWLGIRWPDGYGSWIDLESLSAEKVIVEKDGSFVTFAGGIRIRGETASMRPLRRPHAGAGVTDRAAGRVDEARLARKRSDDRDRL